MNKDPDFIAYEDRLFKQMAEVFKKEDIKRLILDLNVQKTVDCVKLVERNVFTSEYCKCVRAPTTLYEWSMEEFKNLMDADSYLMNLLLYEEPEVLENAKLLIDLRNIQTYLSYMCTKGIDETIFQLNECQNVINIIESLEEQHQANSLKSKEVSLGMTQQELQNKMDIVKHFLGVRRSLDGTLNRFMIENPLQHRTRKNYMDAHLPFVKERIKLDENQLIKEIAEWKNNTKVMEYTYRNTLAYYNVEIERCKEKLQHWNYNLEMREEQLTLTINNINDHLQNLYTAWDEMRERLEYFCDNIERTLQEMDKKQLNQERKESKGQANSKVKAKPKIGQGTKKAKGVEK